MSCVSTATQAYRRWSIILLASSTLLAGTALAQDKAKAKTTDTLDEIVVTGSLIPQSKVETATPVVVISSADLEARGFATIADALQQTSFSTGSVQGAQFSNGFTQGAKTLSMFGLSPSYVKYLIDGLPMTDYPALYNGTDTFTSIGGIPMSLVERIDILPGGQSSLYGSDAIAGVVNIILKKNIDGLAADLRVGGTSHGGGTEKTLAISDGFEFGKFKIMGGLQYDNTQPIWGYQRDITSNYFANGTTPQTAERDFLVRGLFGPNGDGKNAYYFSDPANCANVSGLFGGSVKLATRPNRGSYCGTTKAGYYTINNGSENYEGYGRLTYQANAHAELYADFLASHDYTYFSNGTGAFSTTYVSNQFSNFYDPNLQDLINVQHIFAPEEAGNLAGTYSSTLSKAWRGSIGARGAITGDWTYDVSATYNEQRLTETSFVQLTKQINDFFAPIFGTDLGPDPQGYGVSTFTPNYAAFYKPVTPAQYAAFSGTFNNHSVSENTLFRGQLTNPSVFKLPGGDAGIALVAEAGRQSWRYNPDPGFANNNFYGYTSSGASAGDRTRSAVTTELRLPVIDMLTFTASGRYDNYKLSDSSVSKPTYNLGLEFRPMRTLLARARFGTAFKAPTLSDQYQGISGFYTSVTDYWQCSVAGYTGTNLANCPYPSGGSVFGQTSGNTHLQSINAKVWNAGLVWAPIDRLSIDADFLHWQIDNEVSQQSTDQLLRTEASCRLGQLSITSPTCVAALAQVTRDATKQIVSVYTPKVNVSQEQVDAFTLTGNYTLRTSSAGDFHFELSWTDMLKHQYQQYAGDPFINDLTNPYYSTDFKSKVNGSASWDKDKFSTTVYFSRNGRTPNNLATLYAEGYATPKAGTLAPYTQFNLNLGYTVTPQLRVSASIVNLLDAMPPTDNTYNGLSSQPYNVFNFNPYGRSFRLEFNYTANKH